MLYKVISIFVFLFTLSVSSLIGQNAPELRIQLGHKDDINQIVFDPNGKFVVSCSNDKTIKVWDVKSGKELFTLAGHEKYVKTIAISPDGTQLLSGGDKKEKKIFIWDLKSGKKIKEIEGLIGEVLDISINRTAEKAVIVESGDNFETRVGIWDLTTGTLLVEFKKATSFFAKSADFDENDINVVVAGKFLKKGKTNNIVIYNSEDGKEIETFKETAEDISEVMYSYDGTHILSVGTKIQLWETSTFLNVKNVKGNATSGFYGPEGHYGLFGIKKNIYLWDFVNDTLIYEIKAHNKSVTSVAISPDGKFLLSSSKSGNLKFWDLPSGKNIPHFKGRKADVIQQVAFSGNDKILYTVVDDKKIQYWDMTKMKMKFLKVNPKRSKKRFEVTSIDFSPDEKYAVITPNLEKGVYIYDMEKQKEVKFLKNTSYVKNAIYSPTGKYVVAGGKDNKIVVWNPEKEEALFKLSGHISNINSLTFTKDDKYLFSGSNDKTFKYWDISAQSLLHSISTKYYVNSISLSPAESFILTACGNKQDVFRKNAAELLEWDKSLLEEYAKKKPKESPKSFIGHSLAVMDAVYNSTGTKIASSSVDNKIIIWDSETGEKIHELKGHSSTVNSLAFTHDDKVLVSGGSDALVKLWNVETGENLMSVLTFDNGKDYILFTPDNYYTCTKDGVKNVHFVLNNEVYLFEQFDLRLNRPDIVASKFPNVNMSLVNAYHKAYEKRLRKMGFTIEMLGDDFHIPEISITNKEAVPYLVTEPFVQIEIEANDDTYLLDRINVWINDVPIYGMKGIDLRGSNIHNIKKTIELELSRGNNKIQVSVLNQKGAESFKQDKFVYYDVPDKKNNLYVIAVGVSQFTDSEFNLDYAAKDATDIVNLFNKQKDNFANVYSKLITNNEATRENVKATKKMLMNSNVDDQVIVFVASHGLLDDNLDYYLATTDIDFYHPSGRGLVYEDLENVLDGIPARKKILLIDACHSGEVDEEEVVVLANNSSAPETSDDNSGVKSRGFKRIASSGLGLASTFELMKELFADLRRGSGAMVISSAGGKEYAFESAEWNNGVFTYSLLEGLETNHADINADGIVSVSELRDYISLKVQKLTNGKQNPSSRRENLENDYKIW